MASSSFALPNKIIGHKFSPPSPPRHVRLRRPLHISATSAAAAAASSSSSVPQTASFYELLGLGMGASCKEIKTAYRRLARILHPDVASNIREDDTSAADQFMRVHAAYATLTDPEKRATYDQALSRRRRPLTAAVGYSRRNRNWETDQCW